VSTSLSLSYAARACVDGKREEESGSFLFALSLSLFACVCDDFSFFFFFFFFSKAEKERRKKEKRGYLLLSVLYIVCEFNPIFCSKNYSLQSALRARLIDSLFFVFTRMSVFTFTFSTPLYERVSGFRRSIQEALRQHAGDKLAVDVHAVRALGGRVGAGDESGGFFGDDVVDDADDARVGGVGPDGVRVGDVDFDDAAGGLSGKGVV